MTTISIPVTFPRNLNDSYGPVGDCEPSRWADEHTKSYTYCSFNDVEDYVIEDDMSITLSVGFHFTDDTDAVAFKLRWA